MLSDVQFKVANTSGGGGGSGKAVLDHFIVTKQLDSASVPLFLAAVSGTHIISGELAFVKPGDIPTQILTIKLTDVQVSAYSSNNTLETITLNFAAILMRYSPQCPTGEPTTPIEGGWNFNLNKKQ